MTTKPVLTVADVAELIGHPRPTSATAGLKVARLIKMGLPHIPNVKPRLFLYHQVLAWLESQTVVYDPQNPPKQRPTTKKRRRRRSSNTPPNPSTDALQQRIDRLNSEVQGQEHG